MGNSFVYNLVLVHSLWILDPTLDTGDIADAEGVFQCQDSSSVRKLIAQSRKLDDR